MIDYKNELGPLLMKVLTAIKESKEPVTRDELAKIMNVSNRIANDYLESLYKRGYIIDSRGEWRDSKTNEKVFLATDTYWIISADGLNYIDLHRYWWTRFWTRSVICPLIVSLIVSTATALNIEKIRNIITAIFLP